jgi:hypothetical protein
MASGATSFGITMCPCVAAAYVIQGGTAAAARLTTLSKGRLPPRRCTSVAHHANEGRSSRPAIGRCMADGRVAKHLAP